MKKEQNGLQLYLQLHWQYQLSAVEAARKADLTKEKTEQRKKSRIL